MPSCPEDRYPMIPIREMADGQMAWTCSNPWHPRDPGPCPKCGYAGRLRSGTLGGNLEAHCAECRNHWVPGGN